MILRFHSKIHIEFLCDRAYSKNVEILGAMAKSDMKPAIDSSCKDPADRREERWSDCWPDWSNGVEALEDIDVLAQKNSPRVVFAEIGRVLAVTLVAVVVVNVALSVFHVH